MEEIKNEKVEEEVVEEETPEELLNTETDWEAEAKKARGIAQRLRTKLTKATEKKVELVQKTEKEAPVTEASKTGELDETQLDYLDLKGISDQDQIDIIQKVMKNTGQTVRQALKDEYVQSKLEALKKDKEVKDATPSGTKRSGGNQTNDFNSSLAKYEQSNYDPATLPSDFALRSAVINAVADKTSPNRPAWRG